MSVTVTIDLPLELERSFQGSEQELGLAAKEALAVSIFRQGKLKHEELGHSLGLDRFETEALLKRHQAATDPSPAMDIEAYRESLLRVLGSVQ